MAATVLGSLLVSLGLDSAEFDKGLTDAGDSTQKFSRDVARLKAEIDPAWAAMGKFQAQAKVVAFALKEGAISTEQAATQIARLNQQYKAAAQGIKTASGSAKFGLQDLGFQLSDVATQFAGGTRAAIIFAQQGPQVVQAITMMSGGAGKFAAFMGGPWGVAIMVGVAVLGALISKLGESEKAMEDVKAASSGLGDAQSVLGDMFDLTTGKIKSQNDMLRLNAQLMAINLRAQAATEKASSQKALGNFAQGSLGLSVGEKVIGALGVPVGGSMDRNDQVRQLAQDLAGGKVSSMDAARRAEKLDFSGLAISKAEFLQAVSDGFSAPLKEKTAAAIEKSINSGTLDPSLRRPATGGGKGRTAREKKSTDVTPQYLEKITALEADEVQAKLALVTDIGERLDVQKDLLAAERADKVAKIEAEKNFTRVQKDAQIAILNRIYGAPGTNDANGDIVTQGRPGLVAQKLQRDYERQLEQLQIQELEGHRGTLEAQAAIETNTRKRNAIELRILAIQQEVEKRRLEEQIAAGDVADATKARADLEQRQAAQSEQQRRANFTPGQSYVFDLQTQTQNMNDAIEGIKIDGLEALNAGLVDAIVNFKSLGSVAQSVLKTVLSDLLNLEIKKLITLPLANALGLGKGVDLGKGIGGNTKGLESNFDKVLGGGGGSAGLSAAGSTLSAAGTSLNAAAATLQTAATQLATPRMSAPTVSGGGGGFLKGLLDVAGAVAGSINFGGAAAAGAKAVGSSVVGGAHAALKMFAGGTDFAPGGLALVGERGPELVNLPRGAQVIANHDLKGMGGTTEIHRPTFVFPGVTNPREASEAAGQAARRYRRELRPLGNAV